MLTQQRKLRNCLQQRISCQEISSSLSLFKIHLVKDLIFYFTMYLQHMNNTGYSSNQQCKKPQNKTKKKTTFITRKFQDLCSSHRMKTTADGAEPETFNTVCSGVQLTFLQSCLHCCQWNHFNLFEQENPQLKTDEFFPLVLKRKH